MGRSDRLVQTDAEGHPDGQKGGGFARLDLEPVAGSGRLIGGPGKLDRSSFVPKAFDHEFAFGVACATDQTHAISIEEMVGISGKGGVENSAGTRPALGQALDNART